MERGTRESKWRRVEQIVDWLRANAERVEALDKVQLTFDCAGRGVSVTVKEITRIARMSGLNTDLRKNAEK
jgi:hypothetical protein